VRCDDPRCSEASKRWWSRKHAAIVARRLVEVEAEGRRLVEATLPFPHGVRPDEVAGIVAGFRRAISAANRRKADVKFTAPFHARGRNGGAAHLHLLIHTGRTAREVKVTLRDAWRKATGQSLPVHCEPIRNAVGVARYAFGDTRHHRRNPEVLKRGGPPAVFSNRFFGAGGARKAWRDYCAERHKPPDPEALAERAAIQAVEREESAWIEKVIGR
jgi:hypothetical protein